MKFSTKYKQVLYCPKCNKEDVKINAVDEEIYRVSMDEYIAAYKNNPTGMSDSTCVLQHFKYRAVCGFCGYSVEFQLTS